MVRYHLMPRTKYVYSVYDLDKKAHVAFFSSLDKASEFCKAHAIKVANNHWASSSGLQYTGKHNAAWSFRVNNIYCESDRFYTHLYIKIPLDENGQLKF